MGYAETYRDIGIGSAVAGANAWQQIQLLLDKLKSCLVESMAALEQQDIPLKCQKISRANAIVVYLQDCLNAEADPALVEKLQGIYSHMEYTLFMANAKNDPAFFTEALTITDNLITWWQNVQPE